MAEKTEKLAIVERDEWLAPVEGEIAARHRRYRERLRELAGEGTLSDFANGYRWFGFQRDEMLSGWWFREWLPEARDVYLFGDFNGWQRTELRLERSADGVWSIFLPDGMYGDRLVHGSLYKMHVHGRNGWHDRIPAYARRVVQDGETKNFTAQFWNPVPFDWGDSREKHASAALRPAPKSSRAPRYAAVSEASQALRVHTFDGDDGGDCSLPCEPLLIYEAHVGMSQEREGVGTYAEFTEKVLPRIAAGGYNTLQLMAVAEHPYYGSFGYHVSNFFAVSSRSGTPEDLKALIKKAHEMGMAVVMDLVHAHYVKNLNEGLASLDGSDHLYSKPGDEGYQKYWDSMLFDYGKTGVTHFLLSNIKFWLDEFRFDGFRFDGVTSMIYHHHGYTEFDSRDKFFGPDVNTDALAYLALANHLVHEFRPGAVTIAEDVSGMPGMALPIADGGVGFDYRLGMAIPDFWIKMLKEVPDEEWNVWDIWNVMTDRLPDVKTVAYAESHDQALVGDKTIAFRLMDAAMYGAMERGTENLQVERGVALHKMIRLVTLAAGGNAYLNFMGNEFGHPEWVDFPREGNGWSYAHARRQWSLADSPFLRYGQLLEFDRAMIEAICEHGVLKEPYPWRLQMDEGAQTMVFSRGGSSREERTSAAPHPAPKSTHTSRCAEVSELSPALHTHASDENGPVGGEGRLVFVFNWHPSHSQPGYTVEVPAPGRYRLLLSTDEERFGGQGRQSPGDSGSGTDQQSPASGVDVRGRGGDHFSRSSPDGTRHFIDIYNVCRTASIFVKV